MARTFYDVLMISPAADGRLLAVVYRHLAKRYHPDVDRSPEAAARMTELNEAYATLSDRATRALYDEHIGLGAGRSAQDSRVEGAPDAQQSEADGGSDVADPTAPPHGPTAPSYGEAGPPPVNPAPSGAVLTFGRYRGWTLNQVGRFDRDYLEWLARTTMGRTYARELELLLRRR